MAAVCAISSYSVSAAENKDHEPEKNQEAPKADLRGTKESPFVVQAIPTDRAYAKTSEEKEQEQNKASVDAVIAYSTFGLAVVTALLALFTLGLMIFTYKLWRTTLTAIQSADAAARKQALDTRESLDIATKTVKEMRANARHELRAYVSLSLRQEPSKEDPAYGWIAQIVPELRNSGATPTRLLELAIETASMKEELAYSGNFFTPHAMKFEQNISVQPRSTADGKTIEIQERQLEEADPLYIWGVVKYRDIFLKYREWRTEFCFRIHVDPHGAALRLRFEPYGIHNRADDECGDQMGLTTIT